MSTAMLVVTLEQMHALFTFANIFVVKIARDLRDSLPKKVAVLLDFVQITSTHPQIDPI